MNVEFLLALRKRTQLTNNKQEKQTSRILPCSFMDLKKSVVSFMRSPHSDPEPSLDLHCPFMDLKSDISLMRSPQTKSRLEREVPHLNLHRSFMDLKSDISFMRSPYTENRLEGASPSTPPAQRPDPTSSYTYTTSQNLLQQGAHTPLSHTHDGSKLTEERQHKTSTAMDSTAQTALTTVLLPNIRTSPAPAQVPHCQCSSFSCGPKRVCEPDESRSLRPCTRWGARTGPDNSQWPSPPRTG
jgi:hypothetical protein